MARAASFSLSRLPWYSRVCVPVAASSVMLLLPNSSALIARGSVISPYSRFEPAPLRVHAFAARRFGNTLTSGRWRAGTMRYRSGDMPATRHFTARLSGSASPCSQATRGSAFRLSQPGASARHPQGIWPHGGTKKPGGAHRIGALRPCTMQSPCGAEGEEARLRRGLWCSLFSQRPYGLRHSSNSTSQSGLSSKKSANLLPADSLFARP